MGTKPEKDLGSVGYRNEHYVILSWSFGEEKRKEGIITYFHFAQEFTRLDKMTFFPLAWETGS